MLSLSKIVKDCRQQDKQDVEETQDEIEGEKQLVIDLLKSVFKSLVFVSNRIQFFATEKRKVQRNASKSNLKYESLLVEISAESQILQSKVSDFLDIDHIKSGNFKEHQSDFDP